MTFCVKTETVKYSKTMDMLPILIFFVGRLVDISETAFFEEVKTSFRAFRGEGWSDCIVQAENKMAEFSDKPDNHRYAIGIINLYTQNCMRSPSEKWYTILNKNMRSGDPELIWETAGDLLNRAIDVIGPDKYDTVYRGCMHDPGKLIRGAPFRFHQLLSTSLSSRTAANFACKGGVLYIIYNVVGLKVKLYSAIPGENEVLLKSTEQFTVAHDPVVDPGTIANKKAELGVSGKLSKVIYLYNADDSPKDAASTNGQVSTNCEVVTIAVMVPGVLFVKYATSVILF